MEYHLNFDSSVIEPETIEVSSDNLIHFKENVRALPENTSKTAYACEMIVELLKAAGGNYIKHKIILGALNEIKDSETNSRLFSDGNINSGFNALNKKLSKFNIVKSRLQGGVFYRYTEDKFELILEEINSEDESIEKEKIDELKSDVLSHLINAIDLNTNLKAKLLYHPDKVTEEILELSTKLADIEIFILKNREKI